MLEWAQNQAPLVLSVLGQQEKGRLKGSGGVSGATDRKGEGMACTMGIVGP